MMNMWTPAKLNLIMGNSYIRAGTSGAFSIYTDNWFDVNGVSGYIFRAGAGAYTDTILNGDVNSLTFHRKSIFRDSVTAVTFVGSGSGLTGLNATNISSGSLPWARLPNSGASAGSYTNSNVTVNQYGLITAISTGTGGGGDGNATSFMGKDLDTSLTFGVTKKVFVYNSTTGNFELKAALSIGNYLVNRILKYVASDSATAGSIDVGTTSDTLATRAYVNKMKVLTSQGFDSSIVVAQKSLLFYRGQNQIVDSVKVAGLGTSPSMVFNIYTGTTFGTATDSLFSSALTFNTSNGEQAVTSFKNSGALGWKMWWIKFQSVATKPVDLMVTLIGHYQ
jgi:hypothetical protein